jgi:hypothetical protein
MKKDFVVTKDPTLQEFEEMQKLYKPGDTPPSILDVLTQSNIIKGMSDLLDHGWYIDIGTGKITCKPGIDHTIPWIYVNPDPNMYCGLYQRIFDTAKFVPSYCMDCYKVVVKLKTVKQLFQLYEAQISVAKANGWYCKCGLEARAYVPVQYGGYFYCRGLKQGQKRWRQVREMVDEHIDQGPDDLSNLKDLGVAVTLKKYCTEFELQLGPTKEYKRPVHADLIEKRIASSMDKYVLKQQGQSPQYLVDHVMWKWIVYAWERGDMTCLRFNNGEPFYRSSQTYHDELETEYYESKIKLIENKKESANG